MRLRCGSAQQPCQTSEGDAHCEPGLGCHDGICAEGPSRACAAGEWHGADGCLVDPCRASTSCRVFGKCTALQGFCMAMVHADCEGSEGCTQWGECVAGDLPWDTAPSPLPRHRTCWPATPCDTGLGTEKVNACAEIGLCAADQGRCLAKAAGPCGMSQACTTTGACDIKDGECWRSVTSDAQCAEGGENQDVCASFGFCELRGGACVAGTDQHCAGSFLCEAYGECWAHDGEYWAAPFLTK